MGKTLKVVRYRGCNLYIRFLGQRRFEALVSFRGQIYCHQVWIDKAGRQEQRLNGEEVMAGGLDQCLRAAIQLVDNLKIELSWEKVAKNKIIKLWQKTQELAKVWITRLHTAVQRRTKGTA